MGQIVFSSHTEGDGNAIFEHACAMELEGLVCKLRDTPYRSGKSKTWLKVKCVRRDTFTIVGFVEDGNSVASLHLAKRDGKSLTYVGKAGTGSTRKATHDLQRLLLPLATTVRPVAAPGRNPKTVWVRPDYEAEVEYRAITGDGRLRHAAFKELGKSRKK